jgi:hypothetical protein
MIESLRIRARVANELETYIFEAPEPGRSVGPRWPARRVTECIEKRKHKLVVPYRSLLRIPESDRRPETERLSWDVWIVWKDGDYVVFFDTVTEHYGLAAWQSHDDIPTYWGVYGDLVYVLCAI